MEEVVTQVRQVRMQVIEICDLQGNVYAYKCPQCDKIYSYDGIAEDCLKSHVQTLNEG
jgi:uncharacterized C2H2 Zn-finger protein